jgi:hypothetical protein
MLCINSAGPSGQPCCAPSTEAKPAHIARDEGGARPQEGEYKGMHFWGLTSDDQPRPR